MEDIKIEDNLIDDLFNENPVPPFLFRKKYQKFKLSHFRQLNRSPHIYKLDMLRIIIKLMSCQENKLVEELASRGLTKMLEKELK